MKHKDIQNSLDTMSAIFFNRSRKQSILQKICVKCGGSAKIFKDKLSQKEYRISGLCQKCQDIIFDT